LAAVVAQLAPKRVQARDPLDRHADLNGLLAQVGEGEEVRSKNRTHPTGSRICDHFWNQNPFRGGAICPPVGLNAVVRRLFLHLLAYFEL